MGSLLTGAAVVLVGLGDPKALGFWGPWTIFSIQGGFSCTSAAILRDSAGGSVEECFYFYSASIPQGEVLGMAAPTDPHTIS